MERPIKKEWVILEGEGTDEMPEGTFLPKAYIEAQEKFIDYLLQSQQPKRKQDCTCSLRDMAEDDQSISCEQCEQPKQEEEARELSMYDPPCTGAGSVNYKKPLKLEEEKECISDVSELLPSGKDWKEYMISKSILSNPTQASGYEAGFKDCLIEIKRRLRINNR